MLGEQVETEISSSAQSLPPPPGALLKNFSVKLVCAGPVKKVKPFLTHCPLYKRFPEV